MHTHTRIAPWVSGAALLLATIVLTRIGARSVFSPVASAGAVGIVLGSPLAVTTMRVGFGAFPLACAAFVFGSLVTRRRIPGLVLVATFAIVALVVRAVGVSLDHTVHENARLFVAEGVLGALSLTALALEM
jgi:hypothetical protein